MPRNNYYFCSRNNVGNLIEAGLPNIEGSYYADRLTNSDSNQVYSGALYIGTSTKTGSTPAWQGEAGFNTISFDASLSNSIYGNSTTVQPLSVTCYLEFYIN